MFVSFCNIDLLFCLFILSYCSFLQSFSHKPLSWHAYPLLTPLSFFSELSCSIHLSKYYSRGTLHPRHQTFISQAYTAHVQDLLACITHHSREISHRMCALSSLDFCNKFAFSKICYYLCCFRQQHLTFKALMLFLCSFDNSRWPTSYKILNCYTLMCIMQPKIARNPLVGILLNKKNEDTVDLDLHKNKNVVSTNI